MQAYTHARTHTHTHARTHMLAHIHNDRTTRAGRGGGGKKTGVITHQNTM